MGDSLRVLLVEDSEDDTLLLLEELRQGGYDPVFTRVDTAESLREALASQPWDIVLADYQMPHFSGPAALQVLRKSELDIPLIIVSGTVTERQAIEMMRGGASDFILKQDLVRLVPAIQRELREAQSRRERRDVRAALRASEARYRTLFTLEPDALLLTDARTLLILDANEAAQLLYGYTLDEFRTLHISDLSTTPDDTDRSASAMMNEDTAKAERIHIRKNGTTFPVELVARRFVADDHPVIFASIRDITERRQTEEALEQERSFLSSAIDLLPFPIIFNSPSGEVIRANTASYHFFGDISSSSWWDRQLLTPDTREVVPREQWPMMRAGRGEVVPQVEGIIVMSDGREVPVLAVAAPVLVQEKVVASVVAFMDVSPLKEADRAKNRFLSLLSHELRTPLTNILGWAKEAQDVPEVVPDALRIIRRNAEVQRRMLENLLEVSRLLYGKFTLQRERFNLWQLVGTVVQTMAPEAAERRITVEMISPESALTVFADKKRMTEVLENILENALQLSDPGGGVTVQGGQEEQQAVLTVHDNGHGISAETLQQLFEFFHTTPEVEHTGGGLGLGLPLARAILERHGGQITAESGGKGQGDTLRVVIPLAS